MSIVESIGHELAARKNLALVSIVKQLASAPRHAGASMLVGEEGLLAGTIGGSILEKQAIEAGMRVAKSGVAEFMDFQLTGTDAASNGMICGGSMRVFVEPLRPDGPTTVLFQRLAIAQGVGDDMFSVVPVVAPGARRLCRKKAKTWPLPTELSALVREELEKNDLAAPLELEDSRGQRFVIEPWPGPWRLLCLGGGHVALATARLAASTGFTVCVLDDREEFASKERFPMAAVTRAVPDYEDCLAGIATEEKTFIVIMTRGHVYDRKVLSQALRTQASYIGMIGSNRKIAATFAGLKEEGFTDEDLARVTAPVGLSIGAETPEEIAVSIMAQLIATRSLLQGTDRHLNADLAGRVHKFG